jgi:hypothetical protein
VFISDPANPSYKTKVVLLSEHIDDSYISNNEFCGRFAIAPPSATDLAPSPLTPSDQAKSAAWRPSFGNLKFQLQVTIHRRGLLTRKIRYVFFTGLPSFLQVLVAHNFRFRMRQPIRCMRRPDPSMLLPTPHSRTPREPPLSWTEKRCPEVIVRGDIFQHVRVEVECKVSSKYQILLPTRLMIIDSSSLYRYYCPPPRSLYS